jgi:hypothetical protein
MLLGHDIIANGQAEAGSLSGRFGREERLEQFVPDLGWNAGTVITDPDFDSIAEISCQHLQGRLELRVASLFPALGGGVEAVAD